MLGASLVSRSDLSPLDLLKLLMLLVQLAPLLSLLGQRLWDRLLHHLGVLGSVVWVVLWRFHDLYRC